MSLTRRDLLRAAGLTGAATLLPWRRALAAAGDRRFLFVFNTGGWDPTYVFAPQLDNPNVDTEADAGISVFGGIPIVDSLARPSVAAFFDRHAARSVVLNGIHVRSLSHGICTTLALTGTTADGAADWGTLLADAESGRYSLPHLVLSGPSLAGDRVAAVARTGAQGQLDGLLSGAIIEGGDLYEGRPSPVTERILDRFFERRAAARADSAGTAPEARLVEGFESSLARALELKALQQDMRFGGGSGFVGQAATAIESFSRGITRCASLSPAINWDTHSNVAQQSQLFEALFGALDQVLAMLAATPAPEGGMLSESTILVVLSEMGRTPRMNSAQGKDHWPYTSALLVGPGLDGGRSVGGLDSRYYGRGVDPATGLVDDAAPQLSPAVLGATLLVAGGVDPGVVAASAQPLTGILA